MLAGDIEPGFTIDLSHKDLTLIVEAANAAKVPMPSAGGPRTIQMFTGPRVQRSVRPVE